MTEARYVNRLFKIISDMSEKEQKELLNDLEDREIKKTRN